MKNKIYIGFDSRERLAYDVARHSIVKRTNPKEVEIMPIKLASLSKRQILSRPIEQRDGKMWCPISQAPMATEFAISRFAVPLLEHKGWVLFVDCDIVCRRDIKELFALVNPKFAVMVVKHGYTPTETTKMVDQPQTTYPRKNWSSVVLWNCDHPSNAKLTKEMLNSVPGRDLHAFSWLSDEEIGELPKQWNWLVGVDGDAPADVGILHYTLGGPWLPGWKEAPGDGLWKAELLKD